MFVCIHTHAQSALKHMAHGVRTQVFREVEALVTSVLDGYNVCIFAYGQTGSGTKTFDCGILHRPASFLCMFIK